MKIGFSTAAHRRALVDRCADLSHAIAVSQDGNAIADMTDRLRGAQRDVDAYDKTNTTQSEE